LKRAKWASGVSATLAAKTGSDFGGAWLAADGTTLKVAVTDPAASATVRAAGAVPVLVKRSEQTLDAAKAKLDGVRADAARLFAAALLPGLATTTSLLVGTSTYQ